MLVLLSNFKTDQSEKEHYAQHLRLVSGRSLLKHVEDFISHFPKETLTLSKTDNPHIEKQCFEIKDQLALIEHITIEKLKKPSQKAKDTLLRWEKMLLDKNETGLLF